MKTAGIQLQKAEQILSQVVATLSGMAGNPVQPQARDYQGITYRTAQLNTLQLSYGRVDETLLAVGITHGSFKKMIDTYKTEGRAITENAAYRSVADRYGKRELFAFVDVETGNPYLKTLLPPLVGTHLDAFQTLVYSWELLQPGGIQQLFGTLKNDVHGTFIPLFQESSKMQTIQGLVRRTRSIFFTVAPSSSQILWQMIFGSEKDTPSTDESLRSFLIPDQTDLLGAVAGELVISADISFLEQLPLILTRIEQMERLKVSKLNLRRRIRV